MLQETKAHRHGGGRCVFSCKIKAKKHVFFTEIRTVAHRSGNQMNMQIVSVSAREDEEQGIRNDGSKSSRSHRALEHSGLVFLAAKKACQDFQRFFAETHVTEWMDSCPTNVGPISPIFT